MKSEEFIREVDEELQREHMAKLWQRFGGLIMGLALLVVAGTAGKVVWDHWQAQARTGEALRFAAAEEALRIGRPADAAKELETLAAQAETGYAALARLKAAEAELAARNDAAAIQALNQLGQTSTADRILRDLGTLLAVTREIDTGNPAQLRQQLQPLAESGAPWRNNARELLALIAIRDGKLDEARQLLADLGRDAAVPETQQRRARELLQAIGGAAPQASS